MFSHDEDLASMMLSSDLLNKACTAICRVRNHDQDPFAISIQVSEDLLSNGKIIAFRSSPDYTVHNLRVEEVKALVPSTETFFDFISGKVNPRISINKVAVDVFSSLLQNHLSVLQDRIDISKPLIVTGNSLGGSIASLFTIWLLDTIYLNKSARPICITFGAPLLGDKFFRKAIYERSSWPSCFVHVALTKDPIPKLFVSSNYNPFGLFFFCSDSRCVCMDHPESVIEVMDAMKTVGYTNSSTVVPVESYGQVLVNLKRNATCKGNSILGDADIDSLQVGIVLQLEAIEVIRIEDIENDETRSLIKNIKKRKEGWLVRMRHSKDEKKNLNEIKIGMAYHEWYKIKTVDDGGYYDAYKKPSTPRRRETKVRIKKEKAKLNDYWDKMVQKAMQKPQKEAVSFRNSWLFAGTNYRRMVEPLEIADHYSSGKTDYINTARPEYFKMLEKWFDDDRLPQTQTNSSHERRKAASLTEDSCFWAHLEEAFISLNVLTNIPSNEDDKNLVVKKLVGFENYVMGLIGDYSVSPEIFLPKSTFMDWWVEYKRYKDGNLGGASYSSRLAKFMMKRVQTYA